MIRCVSLLLSSSPHIYLAKTLILNPCISLRSYSSSSFASSLASRPSLSIWRRKKDMGKEGLFVVQQLKRLAASSHGGARLEQFMRSHVSRLLRTDLLAVLAEFQRQDNVPLSMKVRIPSAYQAFPKIFRFSGKFSFIYVKVGFCSMNM